MPARAPARLLAGVSVCEKCQPQLALTIIGCERLLAAGSTPGSASHGVSWLLGFFVAENHLLMFLVHFSRVVSFVPHDLLVLQSREISPLSETYVTGLFGFFPLVHCCLSFNFLFSGFTLEVFFFFFLFSILMWSHLSISHFAFGLCVTLIYVKGMKILICGGGNTVL